MNFTLKATFQTYWQIGTGRGTGQGVDAQALKDNHGLPYVPGKTLKGLFRDAFYKLDTWQGTDQTSPLFGNRTDEETVSRDFSTQGLLRFSNLELAEKAQLIDQAQLTQHLFEKIANTAIDAESGSAKQGSLRMSEVVIPLTLTGEISLMPHADQHEQAFVHLTEQLKEAASLITHIGSNKNRGFGRVILEVTSCKA